jgi:ribonuclease Z
MEIILTGTGTPIPDANRAGPSTLVKAGETQILVDAGRGVVMRLAGALTGAPALDAVLITHLHSDHVCALNDIITTHWVMSQESATLKIFGPVGTEEFVRRQMHALEPDIGYRIEHHDFLERGPQLEVTDLEAGDSFSVNDVHVSTAATEHSPVKPTIGFRLEHDGSTAALAGDTLPCDGVDELARDADAYVQTVLRRDILEQIPIQGIQDILDYHSGVVEAAQTASRVGAKRLVLTHMVPAPQPTDYPDWIARAAAHFDGEVVIGDDLTSVTI